MKKFEYYIINFEDNTKVEDSWRTYTAASLIEDELCEMGNEGWELVSVSNNCAFLKRVKEEINENSNK